MPMALSVASLITASGVVVVQTIDTWWEHPRETGKRYAERTTQRDTRLLTLNLNLEFDFDLSALFQRGPAGTVRRTVYRDVRLRLTRPSPDGITALLCVVPTGASIAVLLTAAFLARAGTSEWRVATFRNAAVAAAAGFAPGVLLCCILILLGAFMLAVSSLRNWYGGEMAAVVFAIGAMIAAVAGGAYATIQFTRGAGPRLRRTGSLQFLLVPLVGWLLACFLAAVLGAFLLHSLD